MASKVTSTGKQAQVVHALLDGFGGTATVEVKVPGIDGAITVYPGGRIDLPEAFADFAPGIRLDMQALASQW